MKNLLPISIILFIIISILPTSCINDSAEQEAAFKNMVDTLFQKRLKEFNIEIDSLCVKQTDSLVLHNMDSIKTIRLREIEKLLKK